jgi:hypothetical protein
MPGTQSAQPSPPVPPQRPRIAGDPYCGNCGYDLAGATQTSVCPECGKPLVEVLMRDRTLPSGRGRRYRSQSTIFGWPVVHIAMGPAPELGESAGVAKGLIAIGDRAYGALAIGGFACGGVAIGGGAIGVCSLGGGAIGIITAMGGGAIGGFAVGGGAAGMVATGGGALAVIASGGGVIGWYARGGGAVGRYVLTPARSDPEAVQVFDALAPVLGPGFGNLLIPASYSAATSLGLALAVGAVALLTVRRTSNRRGGHAAKGYTP